MMRPIPAVFCLAILAGCATQPASYVQFPEQPQTEAQNRARIHTELSAVYYSRGQYGVALEELNEALRADSNYAPAYNVLGLVYMELREDGIAQQNFERALKINPNDSDANNNYGWFLCQRKREGEAIKYFLAALKNPLYATPERSYVNAGVCSRGQGDDKSAEDFFQKALRIQPASPQALLGLTEINFKAGNLGQAKTYLTRYMQAAQADAETLWMGVRLERKLGDKDAEASYGLQLRKRFPNSSQTRAMQDGKFE